MRDSAHHDRNLARIRPDKPKTAISKSSTCYLIRTSFSRTPVTAIFGLTMLLPLRQNSDYTSENDAGVRIQHSVADPSTVVARCQSGRAGSTAVEFCQGTAQIANGERGPAARLSQPAMRVPRGIQRPSHMPSSLHWPGRGVELRSGVRGRPTVHPPTRRPSLPFLAGENNHGGTQESRWLMERLD